MLLDAQILLNRKKRETLSERLLYCAERLIGKNCVSKYDGLLNGIKGNIPHTGISTETLSESLITSLTLVEVEADKKVTICSNIQSPRQQSISNFHQ